MGSDGLKYRIPYKTFLVLGWTVVLLTSFLGACLFVKQQWASIRLHIRRNYGHGLWAMTNNRGAFLFLIDKDNLTILGNVEKLACSFRTGLLWNLFLDRSCLVAYNVKVVACTSGYEDKPHEEAFKSARRRIQRVYWWGGVTMYAIIKTGGKQYRVQEGDKIFV